MSFIPAAYADSAVSSVASSSSLMQFAPMVVIFALFWLLLIRPQQKKAKQLAEMLKALQKGDEVVTNAGILGRIVALDDATVSVEVASGVAIKFQRSAIAGKVTKEVAKK